MNTRATFSSISGFLFNPKCFPVVTVGAIALNLAWISTNRNLFQFQLRTKSCERQARAKNFNNWHDARGQPLSIRDAF